MTSPASHGSAQHTKFSERALRGVVGLADVKRRTGDWHTAATLLGALRSWPQVMRFLHLRAEHLMQQLQATVPSNELDDALTQGARLTLQDVVNRWAH